MLSINTNLSSLIAQRSMKSATSLLNQAVERMSTGYKVNHAKDNAAAYSIITNMDTKINAYQVAEDNVAMGMDMATTISENLELINQHASRIRDLCEQASNGTYGEKSIKAIQTEIESRMVEIERIKSNAEFNGIKLFESTVEAPPVDGVTGSFIEDVTQLTEDEAITQGYTIIKTADELQAMKDNLTGKYILMNDIDLEGYSWTPIGTYGNEFEGELNGNGHVVKNLEINNPAETYRALFGNIQGATIKNLGLENAEITGDSITGILVGHSYGSTIENCYATGKISGSTAVGGLIGFAGAGTVLRKCYSNTTVTGSGSSIGGLVGEAGDVGGADLYDCYSKGSVAGTDRVGGLVGCYETNIVNCYSSCVVSGASNVGGLVGSWYGNIQNSYWDKETSGMSIGVASGSATGTYTGLTKAELQTLIDNGTLVSAKVIVPPVPPQASVTLQVGIDSDVNSQISLNLANTLKTLNISITDATSARDSLTVLDNYLKHISDYQTGIGAVQNRLESVLEEITIQYDNLVSSRSTLRDADIAEVSSQYIQQQILQQASATLMATANQAPAIALQLI